MLSPHPHTLPLPKPLPIIMSWTQNFVPNPKFAVQGGGTLSGGTVHVVTVYKAIHHKHDLPHSPSHKTNKRSPSQHESSKRHTPRGLIHRRRLAALSLQRGGSRSQGEIVVLLSCQLPRRRPSLQRIQELLGAKPPQEELYRLQKSRVPHQVRRWDLRARVESKRRRKGQRHHIPFHHNFTFIIIRRKEEVRVGQARHPWIADPYESWTHGLNKHWTKKQTRTH